MMKKKLLYLILTISISVLSGCSVAIVEESVESVSVVTVETGEQESVEIDGSSFQPAELVYITDGDTIKVVLKGEKETVRMLCINTPESVHPDPEKNSAFGEMASEYTKEHLEIGSTIYLEADAVDRDQYGRLLRYVWTALPEEPEKELESGKLFNANAVADGYAVTYLDQENKKYYDAFCKLESAAAKGNKGLWGMEGNTMTSVNIEREKKYEAALDSTGGQYAYIGNTNSKAFHALDCESLPAEEKRILFLTREEALEAGYHACGRCRP